MVAGRRRARTDVRANFQYRLKNNGSRRGLCDTCSFINVEKYEPAHFEYDSDLDQDWLKSKHRILLYPSSNEDKFLRRKMQNPVPRATGPRDDKGHDDFHIENFDWKGKRGSFGIFETSDLSGKEGVHPLRLLYPKRPLSGMPNTMGNSCFHSNGDNVNIYGRRAWSNSEAIPGTKTTKYKPAKYDLKVDDSNWLESKHRILVYPSSSEEAFLKRKMTSPVPKAFGPRDVDLKELQLEKRSYHWKGRRGSVGDYETKDVDKRNIHPLRLMYPKTLKKELHEDVGETNNRGESFEGKDISSNWRRYKLKEEKGNFGEYETVNYSRNGDIYPLKLLYSKSSKQLPHLNSSGEEKESSIAIPKLEKRCYDWKGRRGSIGDFETIAPSSTMSKIFPIRMFYPKSTAKRSKSCPEKTMMSKKNSKKSDTEQKVPGVKFSNLEDRCYDWKGKRGSIGLFETVCSSPMANIFPLRLLFPKCGDSCPNQHQIRNMRMMNRRKQVPTNRSKNIKDQRISFKVKDELKDSTCKSPSSTIIGLLSEEDMGGNTVNFSPKFKVPKQAYYWKGKRGSIGDFETIDSSQPNPISAVYPLRLIYPKSHQPLSGRSKSTPNLRSSKKVKGKEPSSESVPSTDTFDDIYETMSDLELGDKLSNHSSQHTTVTGWSEDDLTSVGKAGSLSSYGSVDTFTQMNKIWPNKKTELTWATELETAALPNLPRAKSKKENKHEELRKKRGNSMWPKEVERKSLPKVTMSKSCQTNPKWQRAKSLGAWKPAKYDIPNPIADIKKKGIFAPIGFYSPKQTKTGSSSKTRVGYKTRKRAKTCQG